MLRNILYTSLVISALGLQACSSGSSDYQVGGTVTGLTGSGLVLQNNNGDDLAIGADGVFTFSAKVSNNQPYSVSALSQPGTPNMGCTISNGAGVSASDISNVSVNCLTVGSAQKIETEDLGHAGNPITITENNGTVTSIWTQANGSSTFLWSNRYIPGSGWGTAEKIDPFVSSQVSVPEYVIDASGNITVTWRRHNGSSYDILTNRYTVGAGWGTAEILDAVTVNVSKPQIAVDNNGNVVVAWSQAGSVHFNVWANRYVVGTGWGTAGRVDIEDLGNAGLGNSLQLKHSANGNVVALWEQYNGSIVNLWSSIYTSGSGWSTAAKIETEDLGYADDPVMTTTINGNMITTWIQHDGVRYNLWSNYYTAGSGWGAAEKIETIDHGASNAKVTVDDNGNVLAVWRQVDVITNSLWSNRYVHGSGWGTAELVEQSSTSINFSIAGPILDSTGAATVAWSEQNSTTTFDDIWANRYVPGTGWGTPQRLSTEELDDAFFDSDSSTYLVVDANDNVILIWEQSGAISNQESVWSSTYQSTSGWSTAEKIEAIDNSIAYSSQLYTNSGNTFAAWIQEASNGQTASLWINRYIPGSGWGTEQQLDTGLEYADDHAISINTDGEITAVWEQYDGGLNNLWANRVD